ncbi:MAG: Trm112 family protein [Terracidiphilus sp.]|jgi:uncharacterized protein YbaR (Trm112 family)
MPADAKPLAAFDPSVVNQLACPACLGELRLETSQLLCAKCCRSYPIVDGIPVLVAGQADENQR